LMDAQNDFGLRCTRSGNAEAQAALPDGWMIGIDSYSGQRYYYRLGLRLTRLDAPPTTILVTHKKKNLLL
jgi:hypothetical protein